MKSDSRNRPRGGRSREKSGAGDSKKQQLDFFELFRKRNREADCENSSGGTSGTADAPKAADSPEKLFCRSSTGEIRRDAFSASGASDFSGTGEDVTAPPPFSSNPPFFFGGADENGLGPRLGPLVVTGVLAAADDERAAREVIGPASPELSALIGDSKRLVSFRHSALGEAWARVLLESSGIVCTRPSEVIRQLALPSPETCRSDCPAAAFPLCHLPRIPEEDVFEADGETIRMVETAKKALEARGIHIRSAASAIVCCRTINDSKARGVGRLDVDLHCMERLFFRLLEDCGGSRRLTMHCGKVGGLTFYGGHFAEFKPDPGKAAYESRELSVYEAGSSQMRFVLDAEPKHQLVALASLIGKWIRDHLMNRILSYLRAEHPDWPLASGYNDPSTKRLIALSEALRRERGIPDACFMRG